MKKNAWKIFLVVGAVLLAGSFWISNQATENADEGVVISDHVKGNPDSTVVLVEYADFQCPACGQFYPYVKELTDEYGDSLKYEFKHFPLISIHPFAVPAAKAAEAAGQQGKFFAMHDKLFENQSAWSQSANPTAFFVQYAEEIGLDVDLFRKHMRSGLIDDKIQTSFNEAREKGFSGTPSFELNGTKMQFETFEDWRQQIEVALGVAVVSATTDAVEVESDVKFGI